MKTATTPYARTHTSPLGDPAHLSANQPVHPEYVPFVQNRCEQRRGCGKNGVGNGKRVVNSRKPYGRTHTSPLGEPARLSGKLPVRPEYVPFVQIGASRGKGVAKTVWARASVWLNSRKPYAHTHTSPLGDPASSSRIRPLRPSKVPV
jgi:hypothetical protein